MEWPCTLNAAKSQFKSERWHLSNRFPSARWNRLLHNMGVAESGTALVLGTRDRGFESHHPYLVFQCRLMIGHVSLADGTEV